MWMNEHRLLQVRRVTVGWGEQTSGEVLQVAFAQWLSRLSLGVPRRGREAGRGGEELKTNFGWGGR